MSSHLVLYGQENLLTIVLTYGHTQTNIIILLLLLSGYLFNVTVFGWYEISYAGLEQTDAHTLLAGYLKGAEQAGVDIVMTIAVGTAADTAGIMKIRLGVTSVLTLHVHSLM